MRAFVSVCVSQVAYPDARCLSTFLEACARLLAHLIVWRAGGHDAALASAGAHAAVGLVDAACCVGAGIGAVACCTKIIVRPCVCAHIEPVQLYVGLGGCHSAVRALDDIAGAALVQYGVLILSRTDRMHTLSCFEQQGARPGAARGQRACTHTASNVPQGARGPAGCSGTGSCSGQVTPAHSRAVQAQLSFLRDL